MRLTSRPAFEGTGRSPDRDLGTVQCFVDPDELHRHLTLMARAELVSLMIADLPGL